MSLSGSSASRKSIWAITRFARSSSMKVGKKMMRSFRRREKMSNARSPRGVCSTTIGTRPIGDLLFIGSPPDGGASTLRPAACHVSFARLERRGTQPLGSDFRVGDQQFEGHAVSDPLTQPLEVAAFLHHTTEGRRGPLTGLGELLDLGVEVGVRRRDRLLVGDGLQQERAPHGLLGAGTELGDQL